MESKHKMSLPTLPSLDEVALETTTDRSSRYHHYTNTYEEVFKHLRAQPITLLEQGILAGDGLKMWRKYFTNPKSRIYGLDFENKFTPGRDSGIWTFLGNQRDHAFLADVVSVTGPLDICIDDAGHFYTDQVPAFEFLWSYIKPGGFYTCEDLHTSWHPQHSEGGRIIDFFTDIVKDVQDHGETWHGKPIKTDRWYSIDWMLFRKGLVILRKRQA